MEDVFRKETKVLDDLQKVAIANVKDSAEELLMAITYGNYPQGGENPKPGRDQSIAITKLEEAVMWAVKHWSA